MALYSYLTLKSAHDPSNIESNVIDVIESRACVPIAWVSLFKSNQIIPNDFVAVSSVAEARQTIGERSPDLSAALGQEWLNGIETFMSRLDASEYVELDLQDWFGESADFHDYLNLQLSTFSESLHTGSKHLISRKMKVSKVWSDNILELYQGVGIFNQGTTHFGSIENVHNKPMQIDNLRAVQIAMLASSHFTAIRPSNKSRLTGALELSPKNTRSYC